MILNLMKKDFKKIVRYAARFLFNKKAEDVFIYDVSNFTPLFTYSIVATSLNEVHAESLYRSLTEVLKKKGLIPEHIEGIVSKKWILIDYDTFVVNIFLKEAREFYDFDNIMRECKKLRFLYSRKKSEKNTSK